MSFHGLLHVSFVGLVLGCELFLECELVKSTDAPSHTGVFKSVLDTSRTDGGKRQDEIFVDVVERVTCTFNASGYIVSSQVCEGTRRKGRQKVRLCCCLP